MPSHTRSLPARAAFRLRRAWVVASRRYSAARETSRRYAGVTVRTLKRGTFQLLGPVETALLNPVGRDRIHATATFTLIFLFAVTSVDFLVAGGPDFGAPARAAPQQRLVRVEAPPSAAAAPAVAEDSAPTALSSVLEEAREANVVALSQAFAAPAPPPATPAESEEPVGVSLQAAEALADAPSTEATNEPSAGVEEAHPRKRVKGEASN